MPVAEDMVVGFVGAGNMAEAIIRGLIAAGKPPAELAVSDVRSERLELFSSLGLAAFASNRHLAARAQVLVLAVKPQVMPAVLQELRGEVDEETLLVSIAAGVATAFIEGAFPRPVRVVRVMPNTPLLVGRGVSALVAGRHLRPGDLELAAGIFRASGRVVILEDEALMDAVTAVSGSGPAYVFYLMEAMIDAARQMGMDDEIARRLVVQTVKGAGMLCEARGCSPEELRAAVTSKGGTTAAALLALTEAKVFQNLVAAIKAAHRRAEELAGR